MKHANIPMLIALSVLAAVSSLGCNQKDKELIQELNTRNQELQTDNQGLRQQLAQAKTREDSLSGQLAARQLEANAANARLRELQDKLAATPAPAPAPAAGWEQGALGDMVTVGTDILFASGKADLTAAGKTALDKIAGDLKTTYAGMPVRVFGHTDTQPIRRTKKLWQDNLDLSANRAMAVTRYLISKGIGASNIETVAMGENHPISDNSTSAGRTKNRRVEIVVMKR